MAETMTQVEKPAAEKTGSGRQDVTIKFGKGMIEDNFTTKNGTEMLSIVVPNKDPEDKSPWAQFAVPAKMVHANQYGKGLYMKLPEDGTTKLTRSVRQGKDENGKNIWGSETRFVSNTELKSMMESYKEQAKDSVLSDLGDKKEEAKEAKEVPKKAPKKTKEAER